MSSRQLKSVVVIICVALLAAVFSYPFTSTVVPAWRMRIVEETGRPYAGIQINQSWKHYSLELEAGENGETRSTDRNGYVEFPERNLRMSLLSRIFRVTFTHASTILHGSTGITAYIMVTGPQGFKRVDYVPGESPPSEIVLPR